MDSDWRQLTIGTLISKEGGELRTGPFGTSLNAEEYTPYGLPVIAVRDIRDGFVSIDEKTPRVPPEVVSRLAVFRVCEGDILFGRKGAVERIAHITQNESGWLMGSDCIRLRLPQTVNSQFVSYSFRSPRHRAWMVQHSTGSTMASLNQRILELTPISLPPLPEQRAIAHILGSLDDKIELNRQMNKTLEAMARAIFKSWFVDFDPVRAKANGDDYPLDAETLALFPDRFVDSALGEVPEGWSVGTVSNIARISSGKRPNERSNSPSTDASIPLYGGGGKMAFVSESLYPQPFVLTGRVGTLGKVFRISFPCWPSDNTLIAFPNEPQQFEYLYFCMNKIDFDALNRGSTQPLVTQGDLKRQAIVLPDGRFVDAFHRIVVSLFEKCDSNDDESRTLAELRDALLPKLISGELRLPLMVEGIHRT